MSLEYLDKFNKLPKKIKALVDSEETSRVIDGINDKYGVELADLLIKIVTKEVAVRDLSYVLETQYLMQEKQAQEITNILINDVLSPTKGYLDLPEAKSTPARKPAKDLPDFYKKEITLAEIVDKIKSTQSLSLEDRNKEQRFVELIKSTLKEVRTPAELKEMLIKSAKIGGLEYDSQLADMVVAFIERVLEQIKQGTLVLQIKKDIVEKKQAEQKPRFLLKKKVTQKIETNDRYKLKKHATPAFTPTYASLAREKPAKKEVKKPVFQTKPKVNPLEANWSNFKEKPAAVTKVREKPVVRPRRVKPVPKREASLPAVKRLEVSDNNRPRVEDIKPPTKVMGPIDELADMGLKEFHQLSSDPTSAVQIIKSKIDLLEEESFEKKSQGIKAWQQSPLFRMYLQIGSKSFEGEENIEKVIRVAEEQGENSLTLEEFEAISDLNQQLRF